MCVCGLGCGDDFLIGSIQAAIANVFRNGALEQPGILQYHAKAFAQGAAVKVLYVVAVQRNGAGVDIVKAHQQLDHGGFACAGGADNGNFLAGFYIAAEIPDNSLFRRVAKLDMLKGDLAVNAGGVCPAGGVSVLFFFRLTQKFKHALRSRRHTLQHVADLGQLLDGLGEVAHILDERLDVTNGDDAARGKNAAGNGHCYIAQVAHKGHDGLHQAGKELFESAKFARDNIRKTARGLGQNTDASAHYEKGISEYTTELGMARALHLIQELGCGEVTATEFDCSAGAPRKGKHFTARISAINAILGITVPTEEILAILKKLSFEVTMEADGDTMQVVAPRYREDIEIGEPDLAEEVIREYGYDHITPTFLKAAQVTTGGLTADQHRRDKLKSAMCAQGFYEAMTLAFYADADLDALHIAPDAPERNVIRIVNPISSNLTIMRSLLAPSLLNVAVTNLKKGNAAGRLFELSNIYVPKQLPLTELPEERLHLGFVAFGEHEDFFAVKGALEDLAASFGVTFEVERAEDVPYLHPGIAAYILCNGVRVGSFGKLANDVQAGLDLPRDSRANQKIFLGEIDYETLVAQLPAGLRYHPLPEFDTVARDLALVADEETPCGTIIAEMKRACKQLADVELFDIYRSEAIGAGKKSMAFTLHFAPENKALEAADVDRFVKKILGNLKFKLGIEIR